MKKNLRLSGFGDTEKIIARRVGDNFAQSLANQYDDIDEVSIHHKEVHSSKHEINVRIYQKGRVVSTDVVDHNLWTALSEAQRKAEMSIK